MHNSLYFQITSPVKNYKHKWKDEKYGGIIKRVIINNYGSNNHDYGVITV